MVATAAGTLESVKEEADQAMAGLPYAVRMEIAVDMAILTAVTTIIALTTGIAVVTKHTTMDRLVSQIRIVVVVPDVSSSLITV